MIRVLVLFAVLTGLVMTAAPTAAQEPPDVTFEGEVALTIDPPLPTPGPSAGGAEPPDPVIGLGNGTIRITLTPTLDHVVRAEVADVKTSVRTASSFNEIRWSEVFYYWPPRAVRNGEFTLRLDFGAAQIGALPRYHAIIEGELVSGSELRGTLRHSLGDSIITTWTAMARSETPPGAEDVRFDATVAGGGHLGIRLTEDGLSVTSFDLAVLPLDACFPKETLTVRAFFVPPADLDLARIVVVGDTIGHVVTLNVAEAIGSRASGTLQWQNGAYGDCRFSVEWQTEPFPTVEPTSTARPSTPAPTPVALPESGVPDSEDAAPGVALPILLACLGATLVGAALTKLRG